jgi:hypothetical protein
MRRSVRRALVALLCGSMCISTATVSAWFAGGSVRSDDRNGDGRPDVWRTYDRAGQLTEVAVDTNFDGRSDVREYYDHGVLIRRETDRNFDGVVDLIESFDPVTCERVREVADVDFDGRADLFLLFQNGRPVYAKWTAPPSATDRRTGLPSRGEDLRALSDPFRGDLAVSAVTTRHNPQDAGRLWKSEGMPAPPARTVTPTAPVLPVASSSSSFRSSTARGRWSPRGPPVSPSLV